MAHCKSIASSLLVLVSLSASAQSDPISEQGIKLHGDYHDCDIIPVNGKLDLYSGGGETLAETDASGKTPDEYACFVETCAALAPGSALYCAEDSPQTSNLYSKVEDDPEPFAGLEAHFCTDSATSCMASTFDDSPTQVAEGQAKTQKAQTPAYQPPDKNNQKEVVLDDVIFNEVGGLRADPKAKPGGPGSTDDLHSARVAIGEVAKRVLESSHPEREQAPHTLTNETVRDLNAGNKDVIRSLNDSLSAARAGSNTTTGAMHFRTGRHKFKSLYGHRATMFFGPFVDVTGGKRYLTIAP